ncbi:conserved exported hypothetical protein [Cupriavidus oxalaticus]|jgi:hypothetical protein|uniref:Uncharacterized protein n=1 Tax=Cupriavidus oxalaticus TaxID=96344 RepID=A0A375GEB6_9BURK|nr:conserved exported hypothetical protein [Cupriavidus oxalaticus]
MKRLGFRWAAGLAAVGGGLAAAWVLAGGNGVAVAYGGHDEVRAADTGPDGCDAACVRSRGAAAMVILGQRPPQ